MVEDEIHFIMIYPLYCEKREEMSPLTENKYPKVSQLSLKDKFVWLMSQEDNRNILAKHSTISFEKRESFLGNKRCFFIRLYFS